MSENSTWKELLEAPRVFLYGFLGGLLGPLVALAGAVGVVYAATGKLPAFRDVTKDDGSHHRAITLTPPLEARASWVRYGGDLRGAMLEVKARLRGND